MGIPNAFPFKDQILAEREEVRRRRQEEKERKRMHVVEEGVEDQNRVSTVSEENGENGYVTGLQVDSDDEDVMDEEIESEEDEGESDEENGVDDEEDDDNEEMDDIESSESEWEGIESEEEISEVEVLTEINTARNSSQPPFMKAINRSDLVIFVLDARAPDASRSVELEQYAEKKGKSSIFVLNRAGISSVEIANNRINPARDSTSLGRSTQHYQSHLSPRFRCFTLQPSDDFLSVIHNPQIRNSQKAWNIMSHRPSSNWKVNNFQPPTWH